MLEKPDLQDERIAALMHEAYGLQIARVEFLPLGADTNTAVYRVVTAESVSYFLKLRSGVFEETSVLVPRFLHDQGIRQIIPPLKTINDRLWANLDAYVCILYPYIEGRSGFEVDLSDGQWVDFGAALHAIHTIALPPALQNRIPSETFSPRWRETVKGFQAIVEHRPFDDPVAAKMAAWMRDHRGEISLLVERAEQLADALASQTLEPVLCHSDIHAGNLLPATDGALYIVDWDNPILAPKERDLMFIGGGVGATWNTPREEALFYQGYGLKDVHQTALSYYRYERIVQDIAAFGEQILLTLDGGEDREQGFHYFSGQFLPDDVIEIAHHTYRLMAKET